MPLSKKDIKLLRHYPWFVEHPTPEQLESGRLIPLSVEGYATEQEEERQENEKSIDASGEIIPEYW